MAYIYKLIISGIRCSECIQNLQEIYELEDCKIISYDIESSFIILKSDSNRIGSKISDLTQQSGKYKLIHFEILGENPNTLSDTSDINALPKKPDYHVLLGAIILISAVSWIYATDLDVFRTNLHKWMHGFMAGFFLVFSFFKIIDLKTFQKSFSRYDWITKRWPVFGFIYPFLEMLLGLGYLIIPDNFFPDLSTLVQQVEIRQ